MIVYGTKIMHCNDPNCSGNDESVTSPDAAQGFSITRHWCSTQQAIPVIGYQSTVASNVRLMRCNDALCSGGDESITVPHSSGDVGSYLSLKLDALWESRS